MPGIIGLTCMDLISYLSASPLLLLTSACSLFGNEIGTRHADREPDTRKWDLDPHAGIEAEDWGVTGRVRQWKWRRIGGRRAEQQLSEDWVTGQGRWLASKTPPSNSSDKRGKAHAWICSSGCKTSCLCQPASLEGPMLLSRMILFIKPCIIS